MPIYLIAHSVNEKGFNAGAAEVHARTRAEAIELFKKNNPQRHILAVGVKGEEG